MKILDANMILRLFIKDNEEMAEKVVELIDNNSVMIVPEVAAEVVFVMTKFYQKERNAVASALLALLEIENVSAKEGDVLKYSIGLFGRTSLDFVDCLLCAYQVIGGYEICTFDKKLNKLIEREIKQNE